MSSAPTEFDELVRWRRREADELLDVPWWTPWLWTRRPWDAEARKSLARIATSLETACELHAAGRLGGQEARLARLLEPSLADRSLDSLIETVYALDEALVAAGDPEFLRRRRGAELLEDGDETTLATIAARLADGASVDQAAQQALLTLYEVRRFRYRRQRARRRMKTAVMLLAGGILLALVLVLALAVGDALGGDPDLALLSALAGALGGTLANLFKLRDELRRGTELRAFKPMLLAQPAVGAASGLVLLLVVEGGFLGIRDEPGDAGWAATTLLAFAAGLSEALFLGIVRGAATAVGGDARRDAP